MNLSRILRRTTATCLILTMLAGLGITQTASADSVRVKASTLKILSSASTGSKSLGTVKKGTILKQVDAKGNWVRINYNGKTGFVMKKYVTLVRDQQGNGSSSNENGNESKDAWIRNNGTKMYTTASTRAKVLGRLAKGDEVSITGSKNGWAKVKVGSKSGFVQTKYLSNKQVVAAQPSATPAATAVATGFVKANTRVYSSGSTRSKRIGTLDKGDKISVVGTKGSWAKVKSDSVNGFIPKKYVTNVAPAPATPAPTPVPTPQPTPVATKKPASTTAPSEQKVGKVISSDWWTGSIQSIFARGTIATVTHVDSGISWKEKRSGGTNHADCQPLTAEDTAKFKKAVGGSWTWTRQAIWVTVGGKTYAASMNAMPHGTGSITTNNFNGHHCIHFTNSRTHTGNRLDAAHQAAVKRALAAGK